MSLRSPISQELELPGACVPLIGSTWVIFYDLGSGRVANRVRGVTQADWLAAPSTNVQAVAVFADLDVQPFRDTPKDRILITGWDEYDPFFWGVKFGSLLRQRDYDEVWVQVRAEPR